MKLKVQIWYTKEHKRGIRVGMHKIFRPHARHGCAFICIFFLCILCGCVSVGQSAAERHVHSGNDRLLIFTGSDWSDESEQFAKSILTESCKEELAKQFDVRIIDLPRHPSEDKRKMAEKNYLLFSEYAVPDVPFIVLLTAENDMYGSAVIEPEVKNEAQFIEKIEVLRTQQASVRERIIALRNEISTMQGPKKAQAIDALLHTVGNAHSNRYDSLRLQVPVLDPHNISGLKGVYILIGADIRAKQCAHQGNYRNAGDEYKAAAETGELSPAELQQAWYLAAYSYLMSESFDTQVIIEYLQRAVAADPYSVAAPHITQALKKLKTDGQRKQH